jgi:hypothetical protein
MGSALRISDNKVLLDGILWVRHETRHARRTCAICSLPLALGEESYRPAVTRGPGGGRFMVAVGKKTRICSPCMAGRLAAAMPVGQCRHRRQRAPGSPASPVPRGPPGGGSADHSIPRLKPCGARPGLSGSPPG